MQKFRKTKIFKSIEFIIPPFLRGFIKKIYIKTLRTANKFIYIKRAKFVEFRKQFRFECKKPFLANIGERTIVEDFNVWNAMSGNIIVGRKCWFGIRNIIMGPVEIGDETSTGPNVSIVGPNHAVYGYDKAADKKTVIGKKVWISTGTIIHFGVKIGDNVIIAPGSVVSKDVPDNSYIAGNPARDLTKLNPFMNTQK